MHIFGKVLVWLLVLAAGASAALMSRQLQIRNSYSKKLDDLSETVVKNKQTIKDKEAELAALETAYDQAMDNWRRTWTNRTARARKDGQNQHTLSILVGTVQGLGQEIPNVKVRKNRVFHVFRQINPARPDSIYVGRFMLKDTGINPDSVVSYPDWQLRDIDFSSLGLEQMRNFKAWQDLVKQRDAARLDLRSKETQLQIAKITDRPAAEVAQATQAVATAKATLANLENQVVDRGWAMLDGLGPSWRVWATIPGEATDQFTDYYLQLEKLERERQSTEAELVAVTAKLAMFKLEVEAVERRIAGQDGTGGFVKDLREAEDARNQVLGDVQALRRRVKTLTDQRNSLLQENRQLAP